LPPSSDEEDGPGQAYDPLLDFSKDDDMTIQEGSITSVNANTSGSAKLRRGPSASNRGMLDDMRGAQQALKQFTEFTRDKLDTIDKQKKAKEEEQRTKSTILSQHSVEIQPKKKQPQLTAITTKVTAPTSTTTKVTTPTATTTKVTTPTEDVPLYSVVKKSQPVVNKSKKEEQTVTYQSVKKVASTNKPPSNDYDELERPQKPYYVNQPPPSTSQPTSPTVSNSVAESPPPSVPSYNPSQRDSFPLSNRAEYISEMITERFGPGDLGGEDDEEPRVEPYLTPSNSKPLPDSVENNKVVQKKVEQKKTTVVKQKSSSSVQKHRETSPPAKTVEKKSSKGFIPGSKPAQRKTSDTRVSPDPKPVARATSPVSKPFTKATSPGARSSSTSPTKSPEPPPALKDFSPMRPYEGMDSKELTKKEKQGSLSRLFKSISPKTKEPVSACFMLWMCHRIVV